MRTITAEMLERADFKQRCRAMRDIASGEALYIDDFCPACAGCKKRWSAESSVSCHVFCPEYAKWHRERAVKT
jgi:hypothetical protein